jgi:DNA (cytosine-5)-methyltransferase 1
LIRYLSVCSGIEAATVAWHPLGWSPVAFAEIEKFPSAVLAHHYPSIPNLGDITKFKDWPDATLDVLVGGTPCQSFSVAGLRQGLADPRGNLCLTYLAIADRYRPEWILWENVPGVLSSDSGRDFGAFLGGLGQLGYGWSYRVLDAQYVRIHGFGRAVPQRRRRVFVVGNLRDWRRAAAVLFERESLQGNTPPRREAGKGTSADIAPSIVSSGRGVERAGDTRGQDPAIAVASTGDVAHCLNAGAMGRIDYESETMIAHTLRGEGFDASEDGAGRRTPLVPITFTKRADGAFGDNVSPSLDCGGGGGIGAGLAIAFSCKDDGGDATHGVSPTLRAGGFNKSHANAGSPPAIAIQDKVQAVATSWAVRRLTPDECERLQGFRPGYTNIPWRGKNGVPDGPRYKALGNSMAVNVMRWLGTRIQTVSEIADAQALEAAE